MNLIDSDRLRKELMAKGDIPIHEVFNTIWDQPIVNICEVEEQQPCEDWKFYYNHGYAQAKRDLLCEDCISRKDAVRIASINSMPVDECVKMIKALPSVTPSYNSINTELEPCEDAISREEALKIMCDNCPMHNCVCGCSSYRHIEKMPSVTPQPCEEENPNCTECRYYNHEKHHCPRFCKVIENTMAEITSEQARWIPVSEEPIAGVYLVTRQYKQHRYVEMATYDGDDPQDVFSWEGYSDEWKLHRAEHKVLAWRPAPEPYKEEDE